MSRHNEVFLYGMVLMPPQFKKNEEGTNVRGCISLLVVRGQRDICNDKLTNIRYDAPMILTEDEKWIKVMEKLKVCNMVEVKGVYTTRDINKPKLCPHCKEISVKKGTISYVTPIYMDVRETGIDEMAAKMLLEKRAEISNSVTVIGTATKNPEYYKEEKYSVLQYPIAVNRKYFIPDGQNIIKTDYPMIKAFGVKADEDYKRIKMGTEVLINGMLQTKEFMNKVTCSNCGAENELKDTSMEIIPYATEYLKGYVTEEELEKAEQEKTKAFEKELFKN